MTSKNSGQDRKSQNSSRFGDYSSARIKYIGYHILQSKLRLSADRYRLSYQWSLSSVIIITRNSISNPQVLSQAHQIHRHAHTNLPAPASGLLARKRISVRPAPRCPLHSVGVLPSPSAVALPALSVAAPPVPFESLRPLSLPRAPSFASATPLSPAQIQSSVPPTPPVFRSPAIVSAHGLDIALLLGPQEWQPVPFDNPHQRNHGG